MRDILPTIQQWARDERSFVLARVVSTWGSAPRRIGSAMAVTEGSEFVGSVSGGCVEGAVIERALEVLKTRQPCLLEFGVDDERAWSVGLSCGGQIKVLLEYSPLSSNDETQREVSSTWLEMIGRGEPLAVLSWFGGVDPGHCLVSRNMRVIGMPRMSVDKVLEVGLSAFEKRQSGLVRLEGRDVFVHLIPGVETLLIVGATDIATHLVRFAKQLEFETVVIDPRPVFADASRFDPQPDRILQAWPDEAMSDLPIGEETYAILLSHNPRIDDPALHRLLETPCRYIGALGSRKTQERRRQRLQASGFSADQIDRIRGPVGVDIKASSPAEIALSIITEVVATRNGCLPEAT